MEKNNKKVIVPIIIGVALLIALIIGATYAYFQATNNASGTTNLDATTEAIGAVIVNNPTENLYLKLSAYDMQESKKGTSYYATDDSSKGYETELKNYTISEYSINGGEDDTVYNCTYKLNITKSSDIRSGDMRLKLNLNGATINGSNTLDVDLASANNTYTVTFSATGKASETLVTGDIIFNNTNSVQDHLIGKTLSTTITNSDLNCDVAEPALASICTYDETSIVEEGLEGAKYNCKVDPNKPEYTFYLLDNNEDGTSDLIMNANINDSGEAVIPGVTEDKGKVAWLSKEKYLALGGADLSNDGGACQYGGMCARNLYGPVTAMEYLHNATKSWTNVEPLNYSYYDRKSLGVDLNNPVDSDGNLVGYQSFISINGIATITAGDINGTQVTIGSESEPLRSRMPIYSAVYDAQWNKIYEKGEVADKTESNAYLYENFDSNAEYEGPFGYFTLSSDALSAHSAWYVLFHGSIKDGTFGNSNVTDNYGVRPVITVKL